MLIYLFIHIMIIDIIKKDIAPSHIEDVAINILASMDEYKTHIMPVVDGDNKYLGVIEEDSILNMENIQQSLQFARREFKNIFANYFGTCINYIIIFNNFCYGFR